MNRQTITARLVAVVGQHEAQELLETPNFNLGGQTPQDLIDAGNLAPVETLVRDMEAREASRRDFIKLPPSIANDEIDELDADPILDRLPQRRHSRGAGRIFAILDNLEQGGKG